MVAITNALTIAANGTKIQDAVMATVAHNLSNANTTAFKSDTVFSVDLPYSNQNKAPMSGSDGTMPTSVQIGTGATVAAVIKNFKQGPLKDSSNPLHCAIEGLAFFCIQLEDGREVYTRDGSFTLNAVGQLVTMHGAAVQGVNQVALGQNSEKIKIGRNGKVTLNEDSGNNESFGQIKLVTFANVGGLKSIGDNLYEATEASGEASAVDTDAQKNVQILQNKLEDSNVDPMLQMVTLLSGDRIYGMLIKLLHVVEDILKSAVDMKS